VEADDASHEKADPANIKHVGAPMPGKVFKLFASVGERVSPGVTLLTSEAMKMETNVKAKVDGVIAEIRFAEGDPVGQGDLLVVLE
jgi:pyruvate carboxylase